MLNHKIRKMGKKWDRAKNTVKQQGLFGHAHPTAGRRQGGAAPLSYGEERNAFGNATARGPLAGFKRLRATAGQGPNYVGLLLLVVVVVVVVVAVVWLWLWLWLWLWSLLWLLVVGWLVVGGPFG